METENTSVQFLIEKINETEASVNQQKQLSQGMIRAIIVGSTGSGKSSLTNVLHGNPLVAKEHGDHLILEHAEGASRTVEVGDGISTTTLPNFVLSNSRRFVLCDSPGFNDSRGANQEIINAFSINSLLEAPCKASIVFVISTSDVDSNKSKYVIDIIERLANIFPNFTQLKNNTCLVFTKGKQRTDPNIYIDTIINHISKGKDEKEIKISPRIKVALDFLEHFKNHPEAVFKFPEPPEHMIGQEYKTFNDSDKIINFINTNVMENPLHLVALNTDAILRVFVMKDTLMNVVNTADELADEILQHLKESKDPKQLGKWIKNINNLINEINLAGPGANPMQIHNIIYNRLGSKYIEKQLQQLSSYNSLYTFISKIVDGTKAIEVIRTHMTEQMFQLPNISEIFSKSFTQLSDLIKEMISGLEFNEVKKKKQNYHTENIQQATQKAEESESIFAKIYKVITEALPFIETIFQVGKTIIGFFQ